MCLLLAALLDGDALTDPAHRLAGFASDPEQSVWGLGWTAHALDTGRNPFFTDALNAGHPVNLTWSGIIGPLLGVVAWPIVHLAGPVVAFNVLHVTGLLLTGLAMVALLRRILRSEVIALAGGLLYEVSPFVLGHALAHVNLMTAIGPPLFLVIVEDFVARRRSHRQLVVRLGVLAALQLMLAEEMLLTLAIAGAVGVVIAGIAAPAEVRARTRDALRVVGGAAVVAVVLGAPQLIAQFAGQWRTTGAVQPSNAYSADLANWMVPTLVQRLQFGDGGTGWQGGVQEATAYIGIPLLMVVVVAVARVRSARVCILAATGGVLAVLSLGEHLRMGGTLRTVTLPWAALAHLPLVSNVLPVRFTVYADVIVIVLAALLAEAVLREPATGRPRCLLIGVAALSWLPNIPLGAHPVTVPPWFTDHPAGGVALVLPLATGGNEARAMVWQSAARFRFTIVGGYYIGPGNDGKPAVSPFASPVTVALDRVQSGRAPDGDAEAQRRDLDALRVQTIVLGPADDEGRLERYVTSLVGCGGRHDGGVVAWQRTGGGFCPS